MVHRPCCGGCILLLAVGASFSAGTVAAAESLSAAKSALKRAIVASDTEAVDRELEGLCQMGGPAAMKLVLTFLRKIPASEDSLYWSFLGGAISFTDRAALETLGKFVKKRKSQPIARDLLYGLAKSSSPHVVPAFRELLFDSPPEVRLLIAKRISRVRSREAVETLIELLGAESEKRPAEPTRLAWIAIEGLTAITGKELGPSDVNWRGWWEQNKTKPLPRPEDLEGVSGRTAVEYLKLSPDRARRDAFLGVEKADPKAIVVLSAQFTKKAKKDLNNDYMEHVLSDMDIPHSVVRREDFLDYNLKGVGAILVNCAQFHKFCICPTCKPSGETKNRLKTCSGCNVHKEFSGRLSGAAIEKIRKFVFAGGYLFCEDWTIKELVEPAFPGLVAAGTVLRTGVVDVMPSRGMGSHPYLEGIFEPEFTDLYDPPASEDGAGQGGAATEAIPLEELAEPGPSTIVVKHRWMIDDESFALHVLKKKRIVPILTSGQLGKRAEGDGLVALAFRPGKSKIPAGSRRVPPGTPGVVTVVLSHFGKQDSVEDELSIQTLLLNFLLDAHSAKEKKKRRRKK